ncbi:MAG: hypothetical protein CYG60_23780 [Actinobacteria bacterium]|nr:MAG: hypothetical protein CYG60_23780 [Actinomycetota bacterium]
MNSVREHHRPYGFKRLLRAVAEEVSVERLATDAGADLRRRGDAARLRGYGVCHGGDNPTALVVYTDEGRYYCFRCAEGGDVLDLYASIHGLEDKKQALIDLAGEYGVQAPARPESWHAWDGEKARRRKVLRRALAEAYRRRYFRLFGGYLAGIEDEDERRAEARRFWFELWPLADSSAKWRLSR